MLKRKAANQLLNKLHRAAVLTCAGVTLCGCAVLGFRAYRYFTVIKPQRKLRQLEENKELLREGQDFGELAMQDSAPELKL